MLMGYIAFDVTLRQRRMLVILTLQQGHPHAYKRKKQTYISKVKRVRLGTEKIKEALQMHLLARLQQKTTSSTSSRNRHLPNKYSVNTNLLAYVGYNLRLP